MITWGQPVPFISLERSRRLKLAYRPILSAPCSQSGRNVRQKAVVVRMKVPFVGFFLTVFVVCYRFNSCASLYICVPVRLSFLHN